MLRNFVIGFGNTKEIDDSISGTDKVVHKRESDKLLIEEEVGV